MEAFLGRKSGSLVDLLRQYGSGVKQRLGLLADDPAEFARGALLDIVPNYQEAQAAQARLMGGEVDPQAYRNYIGKMQDLGGLLASIRVYHGSPHKFDKFDLSKIGTGEGAQAYGHGAYVAESPEVADTYRAMQSPMPRLYKNGEPYVANTYAEMVAESRALGAGSLDKAIANQSRRLQDSAKNGRGMAVLEETGRQIAEERLILDALGVIKSKGYEPGPGGNLYEANLRWPDAAREAADPMGPQHFLDWDKPLSEQPKAVQKVMEQYVAPRRAIEAAPSGVEWGDLAAPRNYDPTGSELLQLVRGNLNRMDADTVLSGGIGPDVSEKLRQAGIPGIRYLDGGSRGTGQGTSNYVVFDDALIELLTRNGVPVKK